MSSSDSNSDSDSDSSSSSSDNESPIKGSEAVSAKDVAEESSVNTKKRKANEDENDSNANDEEKIENGGDFVDTTIVCRECEGEFTFTAEEQAYHYEMGFNNKPVRCSDCRAAKKQRMEGGEGGSGPVDNRGFSKRKVTYI